MDRTNKLCDIGNGGVFNYDVSRIGQVTAVDLFLDRIALSPLGMWCFRTRKSA